MKYNELDCHFYFVASHYFQLVYIYNVFSMLQYITLLNKIPLDKI